MQRVFLIMIICLTSFCLGFYTSNTLENSGINSENGVVQTSSNLQLFNNSKQNNSIFGFNSQDLRRLNEVYRIIGEDLYLTDGSEKEDAVRGVIEGYVESFGDPYTVYMPPSEAKEFLTFMSADFEGIGAVIGPNDLGVVIQSVIKGSPAEKNNLKSGDIIISANGENLAGKDSDSAVMYIKGKSGTSVKLEIIPENGGGVVTKEIIRGKISIPSIYEEEIDEKTGYISLASFLEDSGIQFEKAINGELLKNKDGIIIDLRGNGGGYLEVAVEILSLFIEKGKSLVEIKYSSEDSQINVSKNNGNILDKKLVVLIDSGSASASEIVAGALKDYSKAIIVGEKSFGKGSVQITSDLIDGGLLKYTIANWYTPNGKNINKDGVMPDIEVLLTDEDYEKTYDRQLEEAKKILNLYLEKGDIEQVKTEYLIQNL